MTDGLAHTCTCSRLPYPHLSSTASGCPSSTPAEPDAGEVDALAKVINPSAFTADFRSSQDGARSMARAVLASDWLAAHVSDAETKARADALREAADEVLARVPAPEVESGKTKQWVTGERFARHVAAHVLRDRAASIARGDAR
jgi:hypothetical protein